MSLPKAELTVIADVPLSKGVVGLMRCPGGGQHALEGDISLIRDWGADLVITLMESEELARLGLNRLGAAFAAHGLRQCHLPIRDFDVPGAETLALWRALSPDVHTLLERDGRVLIHCRGGLGRSGTMAALVLIEHGIPVDQAINQIRAARPGAIETPAQEAWLATQAR
jgi:ADP-ribosyl-[dinitrogen reductase] hydrolase